jgi:hypothetical protein
VLGPQSPHLARNGVLRTTRCASLTARLDRTTRARRSGERCVDCGRRTQNESALERGAKAGTLYGAAQVRAGQAHQAKRNVAGASPPLFSARRPPSRTTRCVEDQPCSRPRRPESATVRRRHRR